MNALRVMSSGVLLTFILMAAVSAVSAEADSDLDGLPDAYEELYACLDPEIADGHLDPDGDGIGSRGEFNSGTLPCAQSSDGDACADSNELGANEGSGGARDPLDGWDFFDVTLDASIDLADTLSVLSYFGDDGTSVAGSARDRWSPLSAQPWRTAPANDGVDLTDALTSLRSFGHDCSQITGSRPYAMGWAPTPPVATVESVIATAESLAAVSEYTLIQRAVPWARLLGGESMQAILNEDQQLVNFLGFLDLELIWLVDPLDGLDRTTEPPELVAAGRSILEPAIRAMHEDWTRAVVDRFDPVYIGLGSEINTLAAHGDQALYLELVDMINELAPQVRAISPGTQVFVSFQMEDAWHAPGFPPQTLDHFALIDDFDIDALGLSSYPSFNYPTVFALPAEYYQRFDEATDLPLVQVEGGWASAGPGTPQEQVDYVERVGDMLAAVDARLWVMLLYADLDLDDPSWNNPDPFLGNFAHMGIVDVSLQPKPAYAPWLARFERAHIS